MKEGIHPNYYQAKVVWALATGTLSVIDADGVSQQLATGLTHYMAANYWHMLKVVCDLSTGKYVRVVFDDLEYDWLLKIPNREDNVLTHAEAIRDFAYRMRGRRVDRAVVAGRWN